MKILKLKRLNEPRFDELFAMISDLEDVLNSNPEDENWGENLKSILDFQDTDGSFNLLDMERMPSEARIDFRHIPTYLCSAILMKALMMNPESFTLREKSQLSKGLKASCARNLRGHGYEAFKEQIRALNMFIEGGLREFMDIHPELCPEFSEMIDGIISYFRKREENGDFSGSWNESYEKEIRQVNEYFSKRNVFVYGTLMRGECNHHHLDDSTCLGPATIEGYDMYDVGWYPAIVSGDGLIIGELYQVPIEDMPSIDMLEGEGTLYAKKCETVTDANGNTALALVYVYMRDSSDLKRISSWKEYVWYVSYGSNMLEERFLCYIKGGSYGGSRYHPPCEDTTLPLAVKTFEIEYGMYFGNYSGSWDGCGVSFLDTTKKGRALGVAYLITKEQFDHVVARENGGRPPRKGCGWYEDIIDLGIMDGIEVKTVTNSSLRDYNEPCREYLETLKKGIRKNWPDMSDEDIDDYLSGCIR